METQNEIAAAPTRSEMLSLITGAQAHVTEGWQRYESRAQYIHELELRKSKDTYITMETVHKVERLNQEIEEEKAALQFMERDLCERVSVADAHLKAAADRLADFYAPLFAKQPTARQSYELKFERVRNLGCDLKFESVRNHSEERRALQARFEEAIALLEQAPEKAN
jgi:hypothetical protein